MRIAFCGASGTGKTVLMNFVAETFKLEVNPIGARSVAKAMGFDSPYDVDAAGQRAAFQRRLLGEKVYWEAVRGSFVTDRTVLDNLCYTMLHNIDSIDGETLQLAKDAAQRYTHVIVCPMLAFFDLAADHARKTSLAYHELYEAALRGLLQRYVDPEKVEVLEMSRLEDRKKRLSRLLGGSLR